MSDAPVYVYGIVRAGSAPPGRRGILGAAVATVDQGSVAALVSTVEDARVRAKRRDLLAHSDVLQDAHASGVVLPLRFGTLLASQDDLRTQFLAPRHDDLLALLDRFDGLAEMRIHATYHDEESVLAAIVADDPGIARLRAETRSGGAPQSQLVRLGELVAQRLAARRAADADEIVRRLGSVALDVRRDEPAADLDVAKASFLIADRDRRSFDDLVDAAALRLRHLVRFTCTGPLPPHSFVAIAHAGGR